MPATKTRPLAASRRHVKGSADKTGSLKARVSAARKTSEPYPSRTVLRQSTRPNRLPSATSSSSEDPPDEPTPIPRTRNKPLFHRARKAPLVDLGMPTREAYATLEAEYLAGLDKRKRAKALISQAVFDQIWLVLHEPRASTVGSPQFRWWVRKMFSLARAEELDGGGGENQRAQVGASAATLQDGGLPVVVHDGRQVAVAEQIYEILCVAHARVSHGGRDKTAVEVRKRYVWIPKDLIALFVKYCPTCAFRRTGKALEAVKERAAAGFDSASGSDATATDDSGSSSEDSVLYAAELDMQEIASAPHPEQTYVSTQYPAVTFRDVLDHSAYGAPAGVPTFWPAMHSAYLPGLLSGSQGDYSSQVPLWRVPSGMRFYDPGYDTLMPFNPPLGANAPYAFHDPLAAYQLPSIHVHSRDPGDADPSKITLPSISQLFPGSGPVPARAPFQRRRSNAPEPTHALALALADTGVPQIDPVLLQLSQKQRREREARWEQGGGVHMLALAAEARTAEEKEVGALKKEGE